MRTLSAFNSLVTAVADRGGGLNHYAPNRHDTGSTSPRSVGEVALIRDTISHYSPVLDLAPAAPEKKRKGAPAAPRDKRCNNHRRIVGCMLSGARRVHPMIVGWSTRK